MTEEHHSTEHLRDGHLPCFLANLGDRMSSPSPSTSSKYTQFYLKDQLQVQRASIQAINGQYLCTLEEIFKTRQWLYQNEPLSRETIKTLCPKDPETKKFSRVFCLELLFTQSTKAVEHIQQHLGLHPFDCTTW